MVIFSLLASTHMSLVKAKHNLLYTEATEFSGSIKHNMILPHFRAEQETTECKGL